MKKQTRNWMRRLIVILLLGLVGFALWQAFQNRETEGPTAGEKAPNFSVQTVDGKTLRLQQLQGKAVILNFWASWCAPCRNEMPAIEKVYQKYQEEELVVVGVNIGETDVAVAGFARQLNLTFPIGLDKEREVTKKYQVGPIPSTFFIGKDGRILRKVEGQMEEAQIEGYARQALYQSPE